ncbi:MAG: [Fe-Fe] hydrogenase large subunit C-terminal domain-containing protein [Bacteroides sp.]|jgi:Na+-translocating ferredoxin:NAD+ oxidoreductase RNF subunit RnfB|nr:[Fe-Fe] hydrogenase large subunit C-terminal domain-containing protein [Bacteroides sp.]
MRIINIDHSRCTQSYACIRVCPVKAIATRSDGKPVVHHDRCIGCGSCLSVCASNAISHYSDLEQVIELLNSENKVAAIVDPTISGEFPDIKDYRKFVEMIRKLGFAYVSEISFGVDLVAKKYKELFENFKGKYYLAANCPSLVSYVEKYFPELSDNLAPLVTPMTAMAKVVRKAYGKDVKVVCFGPCLSAKYDAGLFEDDGKVDGVLTFKELRELFSRFNFKEGKVEYSEFDSPIGNLGSLYPLPSGFVYAAGINADLLSGSTISASGKENMIQAVDEFSQNTETIKKHFSLFYDQGCLMGPGTTDRSHKFLRRSMVLAYSNKRLKNFDSKQWEKELNEYSGLDLSRTFQKDDQRLPVPSNDQVEEIMKSLGKDMEDRSACSACGFNSCKDFAISISQGLSKPEMCQTFSLKSKTEYIKTLKNNNEKLKKQNELLQETEKALKSENQKIIQETDTISTLLQNLPSAAVIVDDKLKIIESNKSFIKVLGEDAEMINEVIPGLVGADLKTLLPYPIYNLFSYVLENDENVVGKDVTHGDSLLNVSVYSLKPNKIVGAVFRDMYVAEVRQEEIINRVTEVIDENLKMVQNIAFLLGEGASTTEKMLNSIIETYQKINKP